MPIYKNVHGGPLGLTKGTGSQVSRTTVAPGEVFECDAELVEHHVSRGRAKLLTEEELAVHTRKGFPINQPGNWYC